MLYGILNLVSLDLLGLVRNQILMKLNLLRHWKRW